MSAPLTRAALAVALLLVPALVSAQAPPYDEAIRASAALQLAAERSLERASPRATVPDDVLRPKRRRRDKQTGVTLMIIGGSAVVVGAIVGGGGGAVLIVGGVVAAGYGFYLYTE